MAQAKMVFSYLGPVRVYDDITTNKWGGTTSIENSADCSSVCLSK